MMPVTHDLKLLLALCLSKTVYEFTRDVRHDNSLSRFYLALFVACSWSSAADNEIVLILEASAHLNELEPISIKGLLQFHTFDTNGQLNTCC